jgi:hypothetical protein
MTWAEFINSDYNVIREDYGDSPDYTFHADFSDNSLVAWYGMLIETNNDDTVKMDDPIIAGGQYKLA